ncbi:MAG: D-alanyl-D-alanine carboxypeptidase [Lachnospiraceae bacterium]|nr:D-alanyl-D-alanine carboxypeptidase [Lachnospiraceae bacterium]
MPSYPVVSRYGGVAFLRSRSRKKYYIGTCLITAFLILAESIIFDVTARAQAEFQSPSVILIERSTGTVIYEKNADERRSPASITKIMTLLITLDAVEEEKARLEEEVIVSEHAASMGGSQVYLAQGEVQTLDTMLKCIAVASGNDASVAVAEHIAGSEEAFVKRMNEKAGELGMTGTHFEDCCGLSDSEDHYTTARDVARMSQELITKHPEIYQYTKIWMEDITHTTRNGSSTFTLSSTNKLLKRYGPCTGLKTGSTQKAKYCISATASKDGIDLIAVVMGAPDPNLRFSEAQTLLTYGYGCCRLYQDEDPLELPLLPVENALEKEVELTYDGQFSYLDLENLSFDGIERSLELPEVAVAPLREGEIAGYAVYTYQGAELGRLPILYETSVEKAELGDWIKYVIQSLLFG